VRRHLRAGLRGPARRRRLDGESRKSRRLRQRGDNPEVVRALVLAVIVLSGAVPTLAASGRAASGRDSKPAHASRRPNPRTGRLAPAVRALVKANKSGDQAALARAADRMGLVRLGEAIASRQPGGGEAALAAVPLAHGGVLLVGAATDQVAVSDWPRAAAAASALGALLDGAVPSAL